MTDMFHTLEDDPVVNIRLSILNLKKILRTSIREKSRWCERASASENAYLYKKQIHVQGHKIRELELLIDLLNWIYKHQSLSADNKAYLETAFEETREFMRLFGEHLTITENENDAGAQNNNRRHTL